MKNFRGRIVRVDENDYIIQDSDSDTDSEVGAVFDEDDELQILFAPGTGIPFGALGLGLYTDSEGSSDEEELLSLHSGGRTLSSPDSYGGVDSDDLFIPIPQGRRQGPLLGVGTSSNDSREAEDVSLEGYFAFGGERRRLSGTGLVGVAAASPRTEQRAHSQGQGPISTLSPAAIESLSLGEVGLEQILARAIAMNAAEIEARRSRGSKDLRRDLEQESERERREFGEAGESSGNGTEEDKDGNESVGSQNSAKRAKLSDGPENTEQTVRHPETELDSRPSTPTDIPEEEATCNPMVSDAEELDENDSALRGDRIGATTYSERHVLKILMKWVQELPKYSEEGVSEPSGEAEAALDKNHFLEKDFEEEMALLWDMSYEPDVMNFLVQNNAFNIIRETISVSACDRLTEISLGIMANIISQQSIVEDFSIIDASLGVVEGVVGVARDPRDRPPRVSVLIQVFAVLRRIAWFLRNVALVPAWTRLLLSPEFLETANFILSSSRNALLLGNVIVSLFSILEALSPDLTEKEEVEDEDEEEVESGQDPEANPESESDSTRQRSRRGSSSFYFGKVLQRRRKDYGNYSPFCTTAFIPSLCEGLEELLTTPRARKTHKLTSTRAEERLDDDATDERNLDDLEPPIPEGHVVTGVLNGLSSFVYLYKTPNGKEAIRANHAVVCKFLLNLLQKFTILLSESSDCSGTLDYFSLGLNLLSFCLRQEGVLNPEGVKIPLVTASQLMADEEEIAKGRTIQEKDGIPHDSRTFIALVFHEFCASLGDTFGGEGVSKIKTELTQVSPEVRASCARKLKGFLEVVDNLVELAAEGGGGTQTATIV